MASRPPSERSAPSLVLGVSRLRLPIRTVSRTRRLLVFPEIIAAFGPDLDRSNTGPFWIGSGLAIFSAIVVFFFITPLTTDGMAQEDHEVRLGLLSVVHRF